jgi:adenosine deaminase
MSMTPSFIEGLPKAELHLHIEGTLEPQMMMNLAERNGIALAYGSLEEVHAAYRFENLQSFLDLYYQGMAVLLHEQDFYDLTTAYLKTSHGESVRHAEIFFDPQAHTGRGVAFATVIDGIHRAQKDAERDLGITSKLIMCFLRDLDAASAMRTLDEALAYRDRIVGVGLDSAELGHPPGKFAEVFEKARAHGLLPVAHAGDRWPTPARRGRPPMWRKPLTCCRWSASTTASAPWTIRPWWSAWRRRKRRSRSARSPT